MLARFVHAMLFAWILPVAAIAVIAVIEMLSKDPVGDRPEWVKEYLPARSKRTRG